jgi:hypothetical protein
VKDKVYAVTPNSLKVKAGILSGEMTEIAVTERVENGSGRVDTPARLTGKLVLTNVSSDQSVRVVGGKLLYIDSEGKPIPSRPTAASRRSGRRRPMGRRTGSIPGRSLHRPWRPSCRSTRCRRSG